jgi:hypothetical protein
LKATKVDTTQSDTKEKKKQLAKEAVQSVKVNNLSVELSGKLSRHVDNEHLFEISIPEESIHC